MLAGAACTTETINRVPAAGEAAAVPPDPAVQTPDGTPRGPWTESALPSDVRSISCPNDAEPHVATAAGLFRYDGAAWKLVAPGDFSSVHLADPTNGFAVGDGVMVQRVGESWSTVDVIKSWKLHSVYTQSDGAWVAGDGFKLGTTNDLLGEPRVIFVGRIDLKMPQDHMFGDRSHTVGSASVVTGGGPWVTTNGPHLLAQWDGAKWRDVGGFSGLSDRRSVVVVGSSFYVTDGKDIPAVNLGSPQFQQEAYGGAGSNVLTDSPSTIRLLVATPKKSFVALGDDGFLWQHYAETGKSRTLDPPASVSLSAGCSTLDGHLWVSSGKRVFHRNDVL